MHKDGNVVPDAGTRLLARVPGLLKSLREGLSGSAYDPFRHL